MKGAQVAHCTKIKASPETRPNEATPKRCAIVLLNIGINEPCPNVVRTMPQANARNAPAKLVIATPMPMMVTAMQ